MWLVEILSAPDEQPLPVLTSLLKSVYFNFCLSLFHCQAHRHNFVHHFFPVKPIIRSCKDFITNPHLKVRLSPSRKKNVITCFNDSPSKMMKNAFLFKSSFCSQDI